MNRFGAAGAVAPEAAREFQLKNSSAMRWCALLAGAVLALHTASAPAADAAPAATGSMPGHPQGFDWIEHTQRTLNELKGKLNLAPGQLAAWDAWSAGVMKDAHQQLDQKKPWLEEQEAGAEPGDESTTPERMTRGIEHLRAETAWMQDHLVRLEAARARTSAFYDALDTNQKTIFDLFWHEVYDRTTGYDGGGGMHRSGMHQHEGFGPCGP